MNSRLPMVILVMILTMLAAACGTEGEGADLHKLPTEVSPSDESIQIFSRWTDSIEETNQNFVKRSKITERDDITSSPEIRIKVLDKTTIVLLWDDTGYSTMIRIINSEFDLINERIIDWWENPTNSDSHYLTVTLREGSYGIEAFHVPGFFLSRTPPRLSPSWYSIIDMESSNIPTSEPSTETPISNCTQEDLLLGNKCIKEDGSVHQD